MEIKELIGWLFGLIILGIIMFLYLEGWFNQQSRIENRINRMKNKRLKAIELNKVNQLMESEYRLRNNYKS
jgi:hypothetical protein